ncbi:MAG: DUF4236 domain-containing protein [Steroidobacteraceae bacterium]
MGLRYYRRIHLVPGVRVNLGTRGVSVSVGHRGAWYTTGSHGRRTATLGIPGSGLRYTTTRGGGRRARPRVGPKPAPSFLRGLGTLAMLILVAWVVYTKLRP